MGYSIIKTDVILTCQQMRDIVTALERVRDAESKEDAQLWANRLLAALTLDGVLRQTGRDYNGFPEPETITGKVLSVNEDGSTMVVEIGGDEVECFNPLGAKVGEVTPIAGRITFPAGAGPQPPHE